MGVVVANKNGIIVAEKNGAQHFPMQSVFKFHIAIVMLSEIEKGKFTLDQPIEIKKTDLLPKPGVLFVTNIRMEPPLLFERLFNTPFLKATTMVVISYCNF